MFTNKLNITQIRNNNLFDSAPAGNLKLYTKSLNCIKEKIIYTTSTTSGLDSRYKAAESCNCNFFQRLQRDQALDAFDNAMLGLGRNKHDSRQLQELKTATIELIQQQVGNCHQQSVILAMYLLAHGISDKAISFVEFDNYHAQDKYDPNHEGHILLKVKDKHGDFYLDPLAGHLYNEKDMESQIKASSALTGEKLYKLVGLSDLYIQKSELAIDKHLPFLPDCFTKSEISELLKL